MQQGNRARRAAWIVLMVSLSLFPRLLVAHEIDVQSLVGERWYGLYMNGQKAGFSKDAVAIEKDGSIRVTEDAKFRISMMSAQQNMHMLVDRFYTAQGELEKIVQEVTDTNGTKRFEARVDGDELVLACTVGSATHERRLPKPKETLRDALKQAELVGKDAKVGDALPFATFEPMYEREIEGVCKIAGVEERVLDGAPTKVFKVESDLTTLGIKSVSYVAEDGTVLEDRIAEVITMRLEPKEIAQDVQYNNDVIVSNAAMVDQPIDNPHTRASLRLRITGPLTPEHGFSDERQQLTFRDGGFDFTGKRVSLEGFRAARLPIVEPDVRQWLKPTTFVQSDDPKLVAKAKEIVGNETDAAAISNVLCHWVYENVRTSYSAQLSNALEVLEHPEGDCTEHSILFIGLARAAGLPSREAAGVIYVSTPKPGFYFHQWAMVWVGKWIDVDPTFNQPVADATHVKLAEGDLFEQARLIPVIGQLRIKVLDTADEAKK